MQFRKSRERGRRNAGVKGWSCCFIKNGHRRPCGKGDIEIGPKESEKVSHVILGEKSFGSRGESTCKILKCEDALHVLGPARRLKWPRLSEQRVSGSNGGEVRVAELGGNC